jgi:hypothetical protein
MKLTNKIVKYLRNVGRPVRVHKIASDIFCNERSVETYLGILHAEMDEIKRTAPRTYVWDEHGEYTAYVSTRSMIEDELVREGKIVKEDFCKRHNMSDAEFFSGLTNVKRNSISNITRKTVYTMVRE